jgi:DeoR/GlpR family transcriptional regulator of sugar metabolism
MDVVEDRDRLASFRSTDRRAWITDFILEHGSVLVDDLAEVFSVSRMTIHRDLDFLETQGVLRKVRNGATVQPSNLYESDVRYRLRQQLKEKAAIAQAALPFIEPGQAVILDEATSLIPLARLLPDLAPLTIITNFLPILTELSAAKGIRLIALGGEYFPHFDSFTGLLTEQAVMSLRADIYLTSTTATSDGILFHPNEQMVKVKHRMMAVSSRSVVLLDHTKFGKVALHRLAPVRDFDVAVVDAAIAPTYLAELKETGVHIEIAEV